MMAEKGLSEDQIEGTGKDGRILKGDVLAFIKQREASATEAETTPPPVGHPTPAPPPTPAAAPTPDTAEMAARRPLFNPASAVP